MRRSPALAAVTLAVVAASCGGSDTNATPPASIDAPATTEQVAPDTEADVVPDAAPASESGSDTTVEPAGSPTQIEPDVDAVDTSNELFPDILSAVATETNGSWQFDVTVSSPYDSPQRYADGFRILGPDGTELGFRLLTHDHASEQPFTRSLQNVVIPDSVTSVTIEGRDQVSGFGGDTVELALPGR